MKTAPTRRRRPARGPVSVRFSETAWLWIEAEAKKTHRGASTIIRAIVEERAGVEGPKSFSEALREFRAKSAGALLTDREVRALVGDQDRRRVRP